MWIFPPRWKHVGVPVFLFINKMDISHLTRDELMTQLCERFGTACVDFSRYPEPDEHFAEAVGSCDEVLMEQVLSGETPDEAALAQAIRLRHIFPCIFGAALKLDGVPALFDLLQRLTLPLEERPEFGARVYKITEDEQGSRLTHMKITGGVLQPTRSTPRAATSGRRPTGLSGRD